MAELSSEELEKIVKEEDNSIKPMKEFESPEKLYQELIASVRKYHPSTDISLIEKAYNIAYEAHKGQVRKSENRISSIHVRCDYFGRVRA